MPLYANFTHALNLRSAIVALATLLAIGCGDGGTAPEPPPPNRAPVAQGSIPAQTVLVGESVTVNVASAFSDPDGDALTYTAASGAAGVVSVSVSGSTLTLVGVAEGNTTVTVTAADPHRLTAEQTFPVTVETPNRAPETVGTIPAQSLTVGQTVLLDVAEFFRDPDEDALTYAAVSSPAGVVSVSVSASTMSLVGVADGTADGTVTATDPEGLTATTPFTVTADYGDSIQTAAPVAIGDTVWAVMTDGDEDFFSITIPRDGFPLRAFTRSDIDVDGTLYDGNGRYIESDCCTGEGLNFHINPGLNAGTYYLKVDEGFGFTSSTTGPYSLILEEAEGFDYFFLDPVNDNPNGITYVDDRFYVTDWRADKAYAYTALGARAYDYDFDLVDTSIAAAITYANDRFYVLDELWKKVYAYTASGERAAAYDFDLDADNANSRGLTYANDRFYVADYIDDKVYAYTASGERAAAFDFSLTTFPSGGIQYARDRFYVVDESDDKVYAYITTGSTSGAARVSAYDFDLNNDNREAEDITYANGRFYVVDSGFFGGGKVFVYDAGGR